MRNVPVRSTMGFIHPEQKRILKAMTPPQKLGIALDLCYTARELKAAGLRSQPPDWTEARIQDKVREIFLYART